LDAVIIQIVLFSTLGICVFMFRKLLRQVERGVRSPSGAAGVYLLCALLPVSAHLLLFLAAVGLEEVAGAAIVSEGLGRSLIPVAAISLAIVVLGFLSFVIAVVFTARAARQRIRPESANGD